MTLIHWTFDWPLSAVKRILNETGERVQPGHARPAMSSPLKVPPNTRNQSKFAEVMFPYCRYEALNPVPCCLHTCIDSGCILSAICVFIVDLLTDCDHGQSLAVITKWLRR